ncbi:M-phase inducer phosphatase-like [Brachionus plicatilis]|uniref:M-phase inducer phosphatase n=1 Tax=Brachionus plicatilis TaxID=10195 RepID=A0A3M7S3W4_BRAPC|nr:M-phase inducer phosphatase-like [Brachionus plicatilis]
MSVTLADDLKRKKSPHSSFSVHHIEQENINQQVKRLRLSDQLSFSFADTAQQLSDCLSHRLTKANFNEDTSDSGLGADAHTNDSRSDTFDSDLDDDSHHAPIFQNKLLDISNCSLDSPSPFQARRRLFKHSPTPTATQLNLSTPNKLLKDSCAIGNKQITPISCRTASLHTSFLDFSFESNVKRAQTNDHHHFDEDDSSNMKQIHQMIMQSLEDECEPRTASARLIGDRSCAHLLPCTTSLKHNDLSVITSSTFKQVLDGAYDSHIAKLIIVDARYPYEYEAGHIRHAKNVFTREKLVDMFLENREKMCEGVEPGKRLIVVFHCEFSSERGPGMLRFLRNQDRAANKSSYPNLFYPELYLLEGGYKAFYESTLEYCEPRDYKPMLHHDHVQDLKHFRSKAKTWEAQHKQSICSSTFTTSRSRVTKMSARFQRFQSNFIAKGQKICVLLSGSRPMLEFSSIWSAVGPLVHFEYLFNQINLAIDQFLVESFFKMNKHNGLVIMPDHYKIFIMKIIHYRKITSALRVIHPHDKMTRMQIK